MNNKTSQLVMAMKGWDENLKTFSSPPQGLFGRKAIIRIGQVTLNSDELDFEFTVSFDDDLEPNESEIIIYNLSDSTIQAISYGASVVIEAGYGNDTGILFEGNIAKKKTKWETVDKVTTLNVIDHSSGTNAKISEKTYKAGSTASYILRDLWNYMGLPLVVFSPRRDHTYPDEVKVDGLLRDLIKQYAEVCGISVYVNNKRVYARHLSDGDNINFTIKTDTGLIDSPEEFEEEETAEDYTQIIRGYKIKMLLQHRMTTAAICNLQSRNASGTFRVRKGTHTFNESESITEVEAIYGG